MLTFTKPLSYNWPVDTILYFTFINNTTMSTPSHKTLTEILAILLGQIPRSIITRLKGWNDYNQTTFQKHYSNLPVFNLKKKENLCQTDR